MCGWWWWWVQDTDLQWYIVQTAQVLFMHKHFSAFRNGVLRFSILTGPGEALFAFNIVRTVSCVSCRVVCVVSCVVCVVSCRWSCRVWFRD
jgi:hypothetical protein